MLGDELFSSTCGWVCFMYAPIIYLCESRDIVNLMFFPLCSDVRGYELVSDRIGVV